MQIDILHRQTKFEILGDKIDEEGVNRRFELEQTAVSKMVGETHACYQFEVAIQMRMAWTILFYECQY